MPRPPHAPELRELFARQFGRACAAVARAPGRVNLIGEHTDYNEGFVLPMALEHSTWVAADRRPDGRVRAVSLQLGADETWPLDHWRSDRQPAWTAYVGGVAALLRRHGARLAGADLLVHSDVPVGGGLSSSAALEVAAALALTALAGIALPPTDLADLCRAAEHEFAGVPCGIMDQYVSVLAQGGRALLLDCRARAWEHIPLRLDDHEVLVVNSGVRHALATGEYARRQADCQRAVAHFRQRRPQVRALRDIEPAELPVLSAGLDPQPAARARHVVTENRRTLDAAAALRGGDLAAVGRLLNESHRSLRDDYEVSCRELDALVAIAQGVPGVLGARMTGGGFGGCIVAIAHQTSVPTLQAAIGAKYDEAGYGKAAMIVARPGAGAASQ